jgi:DNA-directed RNA polymerase specialized sigma subunit
VLSTPDRVVWALLTYTDWWQPVTSSIYKVGGRRGGAATDGIRDGLLDTLSERTELCRRMQMIDERDRRLLHLWYVRQLPATEIARELSISRRQCFRRRAAAVRTIAELGEPSTPQRVPA